MVILELELKQGLGHDASFCKIFALTYALRAASLGAKFYVQYARGPLFECTLLQQHI